jgi:hypothetical protein
MNGAVMSRKSVAQKVALAGGAVSLALVSGNVVEGAIIASPNAPIRPPSTAGSIPLDVDGDGSVEFGLANFEGKSASVTEFTGGRFVAPNSVIAKGFAKLSSGFVVGPTMAGHKFFSNAQGYIILTQRSSIGLNATQWDMGETGLFGFKFSSGTNTYYGWGEIVFDQAGNGTAGYGFELTKLYYDNTGAAIKVGDTGAGGPVIPEPSTYALALLAAGGVAAYRSRRKVPAA